MTDSGKQVGLHSWEKQISKITNIMLLLMLSSVKDSNVEKKSDS